MGDYQGILRSPLIGCECFKLNHLAFAVIPANAGIHMLRTSEFMDSRIRGNDDPEMVRFNLGENGPSPSSQALRFWLLRRALRPLLALEPGRHLRLALAESADLTPAH